MKLLKSKEVRRVAKIRLLQLGVFIVVLVVQSIGLYLVVAQYGYPKDNSGY
jgi:hypothetical protein